MFNKCFVDVAVANTIFLHLVQRLSFFCSNGFEMARCQACYFFELIAQVCDAGIMEAIGYFAQRELVVHQQFLDFFYPMRDIKFFNGSAFYFRKQIGQVAVIVTNFAAQKIR